MMDEIQLLLKRVKLSRSGTSYSFLINAGLIRANLIDPEKKYNVYVKEVDDGKLE